MSVSEERLKEMFQSRYEKDFQVKQRSVLS